MNKPNIAVILVAAGQGVRAGGGVPKQYRPLVGKPLLLHALEALATHPAVKRIQPVIGADQQALFAQCLAASGVDRAKLNPAIVGGATRQISVKNGLEALDQATEITLIHDAARPFLSHAMINRLLAALDRYPGAVPALLVADSLRQGEDGVVSGEVSRDKLYRVQTPQAFHHSAILDAHRRFTDAAATDDAALARLAGYDVALVEGDEALFKVTESGDFARAEAHLAAGLGDIRTGMGYDVHRFAPGDHVWLCGVKVPHDQALAGHSDADVGLHALVDAILGGLGDGDIGAHFPPSDPQWKGASSDRFLKHAGALVARRHAVIGHVDVTLICERPKIGPHREAMRARIAEILGLDIARVSVKATTTEGLGFAGRGEGIAAQAVATLRLPWVRP